MKKLSNRTAILRAAHLLTISLLAAGLPACVAGGPDTDADEDATVEPQETFTRTIVTLHEDGTQTIEVQQISAEQQIAEREQRELASQGGEEDVGVAKQALDSACPNSALALYDQTSFTGNQLCFYGTGVVDLHKICRTSQAIYPGVVVCTDWWDESVRSYSSGQHGGLFARSPLFPCGVQNGTCPLFYWYHDVPVASACEQSGTILGIDKGCP